MKPKTAEELGVTTGVLADAHKVRDMAREEFDSPAKQTARRVALAFIAKHRAGGLMLDLWGGGESAEAAIALGIPVLSVDDGRFWRAKKKTQWQPARPALASPARVRRALEICAIEDGYRWAYGSRALTKAAAECDSANLDFMGHWCPAMRDALRACAHMPVLTVTAMPERIGLGERLSQADWNAAYLGMFRAAMPSHTVRVLYRYRRDGGQWATVFGLLLSPALVNRRQRSSEWARAYRCDEEGKERLRAYAREWRKRPEVVERRKESWQRWSTSKRGRETLRAYNDRPDVKARRAARDRAAKQRLREDPELRERHNARKRELYARKRAEKAAQA